MQRNILMFLIGVSLLGCEASSDGIEVVKPAIEKQAQSFAPRDVRLLDGPFKEAMDRDVEYLLSLDPDRFLSRFREFAGLDPKGEIYGGWEAMDISGHSLGHWLTAMSRYYAQSGDPVAAERIAYTVSELAAVQAAWGDGFVGGMPRGHEVFEQVASGEIKSEPFGLNDLWVPWYNLHKLFAGLIDAYRFGGNRQALGVVKGLADWTYDGLFAMSDEDWQTMLGTEHGGMNESLVDLYALTGDDRYLALSRKFHHQAILHPLAKQVSDLEGKHVNTQVPKLLGVLRQYEFVGEDSLRTMGEFFWDQVIDYHTYVIGGNSEREGFGPPGKLASRLGWNTAETCNTYNMLKLSKALYMLSGDIKYPEYYERALYNQILASQDPRTGMTTYFVSLKPGHFKTYSTPEDAFWCCTGTGMENHVRYDEAIYFHTGDGIIVNLFIPSEVTWDGEGVVLTQETDFPESNTTKLTISTSSPKAFEISVRHPGWAAGPLGVTVNGESVDATSQPGSYFVLNRTWNSGDVVEISFPMTLHTEAMPDLASRIAIMYGPIVLAGDLGTEGMPEGGAYANSNNEYRNVPDPPVPVFAASSGDVGDWVERSSDGPLTFRTDGVGRPNDVTLIPFYKMHHRRYSVYWDLIQGTE